MMPGPVDGTHGILASERPLESTRCQGVSFQPVLTLLAWGAAAAALGAFLTLRRDVN